MFGLRCLGPPILDTAVQLMDSELGARLAGGNCLEVGTVGVTTWMAGGFGASKHPKGRWIALTS